MTRAAIYARVSTARQAERDLSLPDQIAQCRAHCERQGWQVVEVFCEPGASALDDDAGRLSGDDLQGDPAGPAVQLSSSCIR